MQSSLHNNVNQLSENVLHIFAHSHFMFNCLQLLRFRKHAVLGMAIANKKKLTTRRVKKPHDVGDAEFVLWNTLTQTRKLFFSLSFLLRFRHVLLRASSIDNETVAAAIFFLVKYYFILFNFATHVWILQCRDISNTGKLYKQYFNARFFASLRLIVTQVALFILKRHTYMEILRTKLIIIK